MEKREITYDEFVNALTKMSEATVLLSSFKTKEEAVAYLKEETMLSYEECSKAYDYYTKSKQTG